MKQTKRLIQMIDPSQSEGIMDTVNALIDKLVEIVPEGTESMCFVRDAKVVQAIDCLYNIEIRARTRAYELRNLQQEFNLRSQ